MDKKFNAVDIFVLLAMSIIALLILVAGVYYNPYRKLNQIQTQLTVMEKNYADLREEIKTRDIQRQVDSDWLRSSPLFRIKCEERPFYSSK